MQTLNIFDSQGFEFDAFKAFEAPVSDNSSRKIALMEQLQTTLDLEKLLNIFAMEAAKHISFSTLAFKNDQQTIAIRGGKAGKRERTFELKIDDEVIGVLIYSINAPISLVNYQLLEELHNNLVYPIHNAIQYQQAMKLARQDGLTELGNRRYFDEQLKRAMHRANRQRQKVGLIVCDLNKFKIINDSFGHHIGDEILVHFADALKNSVRDSDSVFRFGGDEFAIIVEDASDEALSVIDNRITQSMNKDFLLRKYDVGCCFGSTFMKDEDNQQSFFERADQALYQQKLNRANELNIL